jgi:hypothetical protein
MRIPSLRVLPQAIFALCLLSLSTASIAQEAFKLNLADNMVAVGALSEEDDAEDAESDESEDDDEADSDAEEGSEDDAEADSDYPEEDDMD